MVQKPWHEHRRMQNQARRKHRQLPRPLSARSTQRPDVSTDPGNSRTSRPAAGQAPPTADHSAEVLPELSSGSSPPHAGQQWRDRRSYRLRPCLPAQRSRQSVRHRRPPVPGTRKTHPQQSPASERPPSELAAHPDQGFEQRTACRRLLSPHHAAFPARLPDNSGKHTALVERPGSVFCRLPLRRPYPGSGAPVPARSSGLRGLRYSSSAGRCPTCHLPRQTSVKDRGRRDVCGQDAVPPRLALVGDTLR